MLDSEGPTKLGIIDLRMYALRALYFLADQSRLAASELEAFRASVHLQDLPQANLEEVLDLLVDLKYVDTTLTYGGAKYAIAKEGRVAAFRHRANGLELLQVPEQGNSNQFHIGQGASAPIQANVNTGSGSITATQNIQIGPAQQAEVLKVLDRLTEVLEGMEASTNRNVATDIVRTATEAAQQSDWANFAGRMQGALAFLAMLASLTADGATAFELGKRALTLISGGT